MLYADDTALMVEPPDDPQPQLDIFLRKLSVLEAKRLIQKK